MHIVGVDLHTASPVDVPPGYTSVLAQGLPVTLETQPNQVSSSKPLDLNGYVVTGGYKVGKS